MLANTNFKENNELIYKYPGENISCKYITKMYIIYITIYYIYMYNYIYITIFSYIYITVNFHFAKINTILEINYTSNERKKKEREREGERSSVLYNRSSQGHVNGP